MLTVVSFVLIATVGCEGLAHRKVVTETPTSPEPTEATPGDEFSKESRGFFKPSRLPGGLSSEAREIEEHFNIQ